MRTYKTAIIGGGAAGIAAAINAARLGSKVIICEKTSRIGRKILASGNGRCNIFNEHLCEKFYNHRSRPLVKSIFNIITSKDLRLFFEGMGLRLRSSEGRLFPQTNQAASVLKVLEIELRRLKVAIEPSFDVLSIQKAGSLFIVSSKSGSQVKADTVILACGGKSYPAFGSDGSGYGLAKRMGHKIIEPVPASVPLVIEDPICHMLQGQKICASVTALAKDKSISSSSGDLLFTKYGLSGRAVLDISEAVSIAINRERSNRVSLQVDMVPYMSHKELLAELNSRRANRFTASEMLVGILPNKVASATEAILETNNYSVEMLVKTLKKRMFKINQTRGWNEAEFTSGGVSTEEIFAGSLESKLNKRLYLTGEMLNVDGKHGGYNLAWAWASGLKAGECAACEK